MGADPGSLSGREHSRRPRWPQADSPARPLYLKAEFREMTKSEGVRDNIVMMSSATPSPKNSWSGSPVILVNDRTAIDGLLGSGRAGRASSPTRAGGAEGPSFIASVGVTPSFASAA